MTTRHLIFVAITPGLESLLERELALLGIPGQPRRVGGGLELRGEARWVWQVALRSRLAESVRVRLGRPFRARTFDELRAGLLRLPWSAFVPRRSAAPQVRVTCHRSRLFHSGAVAQRLANDQQPRARGQADENRQPQSLPD